MSAVRPYVTAEGYIMNKKVVTAPVYWNGKPVKEVRLSRLQTKRRKYALTFVDNTATIIDGNERLYFDGR